LPYISVLNHLSFKKDTDYWTEKIRKKQSGNRTF